MKIQEFYKVMNGTTLQLLEKMKSYVGLELVCDGEIRNIGNEHILLHPLLEDVVSDFKVVVPPLRIGYDHSEFKSKLLTYSLHQKVSVLAKLEEADLSKYPISLKLTLLSITSFSASSKKNKSGFYSKIENLFLKNK